jgi:hypothetical protein
LNNGTRCMPMSRPAGRCKCAARDSAIAETNEDLAPVAVVVGKVRVKGMADG